MDTAKPMFPATPGYGNLISGASITAVPYTSYGGQRLSISLEPIFSSPPSYGSYLSRLTAAAKTIVGYKFTYLGHEFKIYPKDASLPNDRYFIHFKEVNTQGVWASTGGTVNTTLEFTDNTGNKAISYQNPTYYTPVGGGVDKSIIYWVIKPDQKQLPDIIVDDIKRDGKGCVGASVLERVNDHVLKQEAKIQELQALVLAHASPPIGSKRVSSEKPATASSVPVGSATASSVPVGSATASSATACYNELVDDLHVAVANDRYDEVKQILEKGVDVNCKDRGTSALDIAQYMKYNDIVKLLVSHGATGGLPGYSSSSSSKEGGGGMRKCSRKRSTHRKSQRTRRH